MIRIKDLSVVELEEYQKAYKQLLAQEPNNTQAKKKLDAIETSLSNRKVLGIQTKPDKTSFFRKNILNKIKK